VSDADHEAKTRLVVQATRQSWVAARARARTTIIAGCVLFAIGGGVIAVSAAILKALDGVPIALVAGGVSIALYAIVRVVRGLHGWIVAGRTLRTLDERQLPPARVVQR
jgi:hypothetical protein